MSGAPWRTVKIPHVDWGAIEVSVGGDRRAAWLTFLGPRGGRHLTIALNAKNLDQLAETCRLARAALTR